MRRLLLLLVALAVSEPATAQTPLDTARAHLDTARAILSRLLSPPVVTPPPPVVTPPPPVVPPPTNTAADSLWALHLARFRQYRPLRARGDSEPNWQLANYYDRAHIDYAYAAMTGDTAASRRAATLVLDYRTKYLEANAYNIQPHQYQGLGLLEHYRATGDTMSRHAITATADKYRTVWLGTHYMTAAGSDPRIGARITESFLEAWEADTTPAQRAKFSKALDSALIRLAAWQSPDGAFRSSLFCDETPNYMNGLVGAVLSRVHDEYRPDASLVTMVLRIGTYLWTTQWRPADRSFNYVSAACPNIGGPTVSPDLNGLYLEMFGWLAVMTKDPVWRDRVDQILSGILSGPNVNNGKGAALAYSKQFNQTYAESFGARGYLAWRKVP